MNKTYILLIICMAVWGISWVNAKIITQYAKADELVLLRYVLSMVALFIILIVLRKSLKIDIKNSILALFGGALLFAHSIFFLKGLELGTASLGGALTTTLIPIFTFILLVVLFKKEVFKKDIFALFIGFVGIMSIVGVWHLELRQIFSIYNLYFVITALIWTITTIVTSKTTISPIVFIFYMYLYTTIFGFVFVDVSAIEFERFDSTFYINLVALSIGSTAFATTIYFLASEKLGTHKTSSFVFLVPFFAIFFGALLLGESISISAVFGTFLTIIAISILNNIKIRLNHNHHR